MKCKTCRDTYRPCPICLSGSIFPRKEKPEILIAIIQNIDGQSTKEQREKALTQITDDFQYLIIKIAKKLYNTYGLKNKNYEFQDLHQDVLVEFYNLVINGQIKTTETNLAFFGNFIKIKLYRRIQYQIQEKIKHYGWEKEIYTDFTELLDSGQQIEGNNSLRTEVYEAIIANIFLLDEEKIEEISQPKCIEILKDLYQISKNKLIEADYGEIWRLFWFSGMTFYDIDEYLITQLEYKCRLGPVKLKGIVNKTNDLILKEFGKRSVLKEL